MGEVVLSVASSAGSGHAIMWDISSGNEVAAYRQCAGQDKCPISVSSTHFWLPQQQQGRPSLHAWTWHKPEPLLRSALPSHVSAFAASKDGLFAAAGTADGTLFFWEAFTGMLVRTWKGHYKAVTSIVFTDDSSLLLTGGADAALNTWIPAQLADAALEDEPSPLYSWNDHTLAITQIVCSPGGGTARVLSSSLDMTCKVWDLAMGTCLHSVLFPCAINCIAMDLMERSFYAGGSNGIVYEVSLVASIGTIGSVDWRPQVSENREIRAHSVGVSTIALNGSGNRIVTGSADGSVRVWDASSGQLMVTFSQHKAPITAVAVMPKPPINSESKSAKLPPFKQYVSATSTHFPINLRETNLLLDTGVGVPKSQALVAGSSLGHSSTEEIQRLKGAQSSLQTENKQLKGLCHTLYGYALESSVHGTQ